MSLTIGERYAGHFEVTGVIGSGGMGDVYRGHAARLNRDVALKVLPDAVAHDPDRLQRFQREAEVLASLNHPNIAQIHGIEAENGTRALVLELVDGSTLEERIGRGPLPLDDALGIAAQMAEALEAAHAAGVIHRDLNPANVMLRHDGTVRVLDFGLAIALRPAPALGDIHDALTMESLATQAGAIAGTPAYMSPEQIRGRAVDRRTDVWAFGAVLFEMLTGRKAFDGDDIAGTLAAVLESEPAWERLSGDVTPAVRGVLRRCLAQDPGDRLRDVGDVRLGLLGAFEDPNAVVAHGASRSPAVGWTPVLASLVIGAGVWTRQPRTPAPLPSVQFTIPAPPRMGPFLQLSPDGRYLAYLAGDETGQPRLRLHSFASGDARPVRGVGPIATTPVFWSPDARFIAFASNGALRRVDIAGGVVEAVSDAPSCMEEAGTATTSSCSAAEAGSCRCRLTEAPPCRLRRWTAGARRSHTPDPGSCRMTGTSSTCVRRLMRVSAGFTSARWRSSRPPRIPRGSWQANRPPRTRRRGTRVQPATCSSCRGTACCRSPSTMRSSSWPETLSW